MPAPETINSLVGRLDNFTPMAGIPTRGLVYKASLDTGPGVQGLLGGADVVVKFGSFEAVQREARDCGGHCTRGVKCIIPQSIPSFDRPSF